jgi:transcriptional regulator with XRE-family HTH domain
MNKLDTHIGKRLRNQRTMRGLTQEAVAKMIGISFQQVQKYENGKNALNAHRLYELSQIMYVPIEYFFDGFISDRAQMLPGKEFGNTAQVSDRELLEIMKAFNRIKAPLVRKRLADLMRAVG